MPKDPTCLIHGPGHSSDNCQVLKAQAECMKATYKAQTPDGKKKLKDKQDLSTLIADQVEKQLSKKKCCMQFFKRWGKQQIYQDAC